MGGSSGGQEALMTGPSVAASEAASQAQITAAQIAAQAATQNTQSAIQALMGEYTTSLGIQQPIIDYGNQAAGQLNYMLGLAPAALPTAPTAPNAPTLTQAQKYITPADINQYIQQNSNQVGNTHGGYFGNALYTGVGSQGNGPIVANNNGTNSGWMGDYSGDVIIGGSFNKIAQNPTIAGDITQELAQEALNNPSSALNQQYQTQQDLYQQQLTQYNNQLPIAEYYKGLGQATPGDIANIVTNQPGYQFQLSQGTNAIQNAASANGLLNSGALLQQLNQYGQGLASSFYNNYVGQLQGLAGLGTGVSQQAAQGANQVGNTTANLQTQLGTTQANAALAAGQATASSYLNPLANQQSRTVNLGGGGGGGLGGIGGILSGVGSIAGAFSSKELKNKIDTPSKAEILEKLNSLDLDRWVYKDTQVKHLGPYAEDFKKAFGVGDGQSINMVDAIGVLMKSVQALSDKMDRLKLENKRVQ